MLLNVHSYYSLRYGVISPVELLKSLRDGNWKSATLTDINSTSAALDFVRLAPGYGLKPVLGIDFREGIKQQYVGLAKNNEGWYELNKHLTERLHEGIEPEQPPLLEQVYWVYPLANRPLRPLRENEYIGVGQADLIRLGLKRIDVPKERLVWLNAATFRSRRDFNAHRLLRAINQNCLLSKLPSDQIADINQILPKRDALFLQLEDFPYLIEQSLDLLNLCSIYFEFGRADAHHNLKQYTGNEDLDYRLMRYICQKNLPYRYPQADVEVRKRLEKELEIIRQKRFVSYFLINWRILKYARSKGYFYVGRGSGANSIVAYLMRITDVDPVELDLYFERFINLYRVNPPDFDIDFSWTDRDDITRFIFSRFPNVSLLGTYVSFQYRAVVRELGKVFGLPKLDIDRLAEGRVDPQSLDDVGKSILRYGAYIQDFPNYLSVHAGGILITEKPIQHFTATFLPPKGYATTQFDMVVAEDASIYKFDILSQRGLGKIREALVWVKARYPEVKLPDIHDIRPFKNDPLIQDMLRNARAIGCFYVESPAMRMLMKKLRVDDYLGLVAASSVIRPGVAKSGMMRQYILRYRYPERRADAHPQMLDIMPETFGVMVYQEDVIKVAHYFAGLSLAEADVLRRGMSGKFRGREEFEKARKRFFDCCDLKGYSIELSSEVWRQIESFAGYAFAKGHSASYAVESYQSLFLKAHYPLEYMTATLNNGGGFYSPELYLHEARMLGAIVEAPCVNNSMALCNLVNNRLYLGLSMIQALEQGFVEHLLNVRRSDGPFKSLSNFVKRCGAPIEQTRLLVRAGAFRFCQRNKKQLLWDLHLMMAPAQKAPPLPELFQIQPKKYHLPELDQVDLEDAFDQIELLGFPLCSPFALYNIKEGSLKAADLPEYRNKRVHCIGYLVTVKTTRTTKGQAMLFGTFLDLEGQFIDTVHFPPVAAKHPFRGKGVYAFSGRVTEEFDCYSIEVDWMEKVSMKPDPRYADIKRKKPIDKTPFA